MKRSNLDDIQTGSLCVIDTDILLHAEQGSSQQAQRLLRRISNGDLIGLLPHVVWQELARKLMLAEAMMLGRISGPVPGGRPAIEADAVKGLGLYRDKLQALIDLGLGYEPCTREDLLDNGFKFHEKYGLSVDDSVVLAVAVRVEADVLVTADRGFEVLTEIEAAFPSDLNM